MFDNNEREDWADGYKDYYDQAVEYREKYKRFRKEIIEIMTGYKIPVIRLDKSIPRNHKNCAFLFDKNCAFGY